MRTNITTRTKHDPCKGEGQRECEGESCAYYCSRETLENIIELLSSFDFVRLAREHRSRNGTDAQIDSGPSARGTERKQRRREEEIDKSEVVSGPRRIILLQS